MPRCCCWERCCVLLLASVITLSCCSEGRRHQRPEFCSTLQGASDGSFMWMVKQDPPSYFFGTIHVPYTRVWDHVPENTKKAFQMSDNIVFELDLTDPYTISALTSCQLLPKGQTLADVLPRNLYDRLKRHLDYVRSQMPLWLTRSANNPRGFANNLFDAITSNWERKRPVWVMLMVNSLTESDIRSRGVPVLDLFLAQEAEKMTKVTGAVERVQEQCTPLNGLNFSQVLFALNHTLTQQEHYKTSQSKPTYTTDDLIRHYNCGDLDAVIFSQDTTQVPHLGNSSLPPEEAATAQHIDHYFREELIYRRNKRMGERVAQVMHQNPGLSFFFAFGAGHFLGNRTVLDVVRSAGFEVLHVPPDQKLKKHKRPGQRGRVLPDPKVLRNFSQAPNRLNPHQQFDPAFARFLSEHHLTGVRNGLNRLPAPTTTTSSPKHSHFNHLWVRIDTDQQSQSEEPVPTNDRNTKTPEKNIRVWYGLTSSGSANRLAHIRVYELLLVLLVLHFSFRGLLPG